MRRKDRVKLGESQTRSMTDQEKRRAGINRSIAPLTAKEEERFWKYVDKSGVHWLWTGARVYSYGKFKLRGLSERAHRVSYAIAHGGCPGDKDVLHRCDTPGCIRPDHLFLGTDIENVADKVSKNRQARLSGANSPCAKLTEEEVIAIFFDPRPQRVIAKHFKTWQSTVWHIKHGSSWQSETAPYRKVANA